MSNARLTEFTAHYVNPQLHEMLDLDAEGEGEVDVDVDDLP
jgi:hypothetical protein